MKDRAVTLLNQLHTKYSAEAIREFLDVFQILRIDEIRSLVKNEEVLLNAQSQPFYYELANLFIDDLNEAPFMYFCIWEDLINIGFNPSTRNNFYNYVLEIDTNTEATNYVQGLIHLENDNPGLALAYFNLINNVAAYFFIAYAYMLCNNYSNAIKNNLLFIEVAEEKKKCVTDGDNFLDIVIWNASLDTGYCYSAMGDFSESVKYYKKALKIFSIEKQFEIEYGHGKNISTQEPTEFLVFLYNYIRALDKTANYIELIEVIQFANSKFNDKYFSKLILQTENKKKNEKIGEEIIRRSISKKVSPLGEYELTKMISKEKNLEELLLEQIRRKFYVFNMPLEVYEDKEMHGQQYYLKDGSGFLDLLLIDRNTDVLYVVELKRDNVGVEVINQIEKYMQGLRKELSNEVRGIICAHQVTSELEKAIMQIDDIELFTYNFEFQKKA